MSVYLFFFYHKLNRLDGRIFSVVLVVSHLIVLMIKLVQSLHTRGVGGGSIVFTANMWPRGRYLSSFGYPAAHIVCKLSPYSCTKQYPLNKRNIPRMLKQSMPGCSSPSNKSA